MADDASKDGPPSDPVQFFFAQLRGMSEQLAGLGRIAEAAPVPAALRSVPSAIPGASQLPPMPGALTAAQLNAIRSAVRSQRSSVQALQAQLSAFDEQLGVLESIIAPLAQWSSTWADVERSVLPRAKAAGVPAQQSETASDGVSSDESSPGPRTTSETNPGSTRDRPRPRATPKPDDED
jgi:hypothetical protein